MLFVSGMMGPYMSPIPANASAAMMFSFFVAVTVTPWLMLQVRRPRSRRCRRGSWRRRSLGRAYAAVARPILRPKRASWAFLLASACHARVAALFYTEHVTVKLLPFDNKSEL